MSTRSVFIERLKEGRSRKGLTQTQLANKCGWASGNTMIARYEIGMSLPTLDAAARIADVLGVSLDWMTGRVD